MFTAMESTVRETDGRNYAYKMVGCECFVTDFFGSENAVLQITEAGSGAYWGFCLARQGDKL